MHVPFPGSPENFRIILAYRCLDRLEPERLAAYLGDRFAGLRVREVDRHVHSHPKRCQEGSPWIPPAGEVSARDASIADPSEDHRIALSCATLDGGVLDFVLQVPMELAAVYTRSLAVLSEGGLTAASSTGSEPSAARSGAMRRHMGWPWDGLPFGVAVIDERLWIEALNPAMDHVLSQASTFRPGGRALWLRADRDRDRVCEAVDDVLTDRAASRSVVLARAREPLVLRFMGCDSIRSGARSTRPRLVVIAEGVPSGRS
ncbi:hypothetical protein DYI37_09405 [Fulvimarina endophytica]|uniref:PAS domain-containing protein n=1 Tax=Fulvimarina endophytica TaxID=2293836 RepID=A0A371X5K1_9HYPH|nr:hypothetical protein [Fulvimarina endophytica]RFC64502.1 hypothetical protein DYI37_09405 [Fulvimarina endophytica]